MNFHSYNPATEEILWSGRAAGKKEVDRAVQAAKEAVHPPLEQRLEYVEKFQKLLTQNKEQLATVISQETGKPLWESKTEVDAMIGKVKISKEAYLQRCPEVTKQQGHFTLSTRHKPIGAVAVFGPFNFPGHLPNGHIIPALIAGNSVIFKPSELTPLVAETVIKLWEECGLPEGVINLLQGGVETGRLLSEHPDIDGLFFTGSFNTGLILSKLFSTRPDKILALEMGGNNPLVIGKISDPQTAAYLTIQSAYLTAGQRCSCARRLIISSDQILQTLIPMVEAIQVGPYTQTPEPFMGPVISARTAEKLMQKQQELIDQGAKPLIKMTHRGAGFLTPGLVDVTEMKERKDEEIFGPLLQVIRVPDFEAALEEANRTAFGLCAGLLSDDPAEYAAFYRRVRAGVINWNAPLTGASSQAPFGGVGYSGNHRPSAFYAADYCSYPVASLETPRIKLPEPPLPGLKLP